MPTLLLVHGFVGSSEYFLPLINEIKKNGRPCIAIDLYGRGGSDCPDFSYSPENMRKQIEEFIIMLNVPTPFDILGYSIFGYAMLGIPYWRGIYGQCQRCQACPHRNHLARLLLLLFPCAFPWLGWLNGARPLRRRCCC